jgi:hypothetical protein
MRRRWIIALCVVVTLSVAALLSQCSSDRWVITSRNLAPDRDEYTIDLTATYLTKEDIIEKFTKRDNPYLPPETLVSGTDMIVFEVTVHNRTPGNRSIVVPYESMRMIAANKAFVPISQFRLSEFWRNFLDKSGTRDTRDYKSTGGKMSYVIGETMFANPAEIKSGENYSGIVAFMGRFTKYGVAEINIPVFDTEERAIGVFVDEFERY